MNAEQTSVINDRQSPVIVVLASPGSGKTATLVERVIECASRYDAGGFAVITFTNAAARELAERIDKQAPGIKVGYIGTLHGYVMRVIKRHGKLIGLPESFSLIDEDQRNDILEVIKKQHGYKGSKCAVLDAVKRSVYLGQMPADGAERVATDYHQQMRNSGTFDFDSLLIYGAMVFENTVTHLFVDEVQDSSAQDFQIYHAMPAARKFYIGDPRQAIYSFRGGDVSQIQAIAHRYDVRTYSLPRNYRSGRRICQAANCLIGHNAAPGEDMTSAQDFAGDIEVMQAPNGVSMLHNIALDVQKLAIGTTAAVLFRYNTHVDEAVKFFQSQNIPLARRDDVTDPPDWRKAKALLSVLSNPYNEVTIRNYLRVAYPTDEASIVAKATAAYTSINDSTFGFISDQYFINQWKWLSGTLFQQMLSSESIDKIKDAWEQLANKSISDLIYAIAHDPTRRLIGQGLHVLTMHGAKGLEFDTVYIGAAEQSVMPGEKTGAALEEERRLWYVAITRAKRRLVLAWSAFRAPAFGGRRAVQQDVSQFVNEMVL